MTELKSKLCVDAHQYLSVKDQRNQYKTSVRSEDDGKRVCYIH